MIAPHLEPKGLEPNAVPIAAFMDAGSARYDAENGSRKLLEALLRGRCPAPVRKRPVRTGQRTWAVRKGILEKTKQLIDIAADYYGLSANDLIGRRGSGRLPRQRQTVMLVARVHIGASYPDIGYCLHRDHSTVIHGCRAAQSDPSAQQDIKALRDAIRRAA